MEFRSTSHCESCSYVQKLSAVIIITGSYSQVVKEEYGNSKALLGLRQIIEFESDAVTLDIPMEGVASKGWSITPLVRPVVSLM